METNIFRYFDPKPNFFYFDDLGGTVCQITLPPNAPIHQIVSSPHDSIDAAKKAACLKAVEELHKLGALSDCLLPKQDDTNPEELSDSLDSDEKEGPALVAFFSVLSFSIIECDNINACT